MRETHMVVDLQFGSTGKGLLAGYLAERYKPDTLITAWGPNAGHTYINGAGRKFVNIALPNGIVSPNLERILIGPGSVINPERFCEELHMYRDLIAERKVAIHIHEAAAVVNESHRIAEASYGFSIGSTMKGVGEAMIQKIRRQAPYNTAGLSLWNHPILGPKVCSAGYYNKQMDRAEVALVEGAQGFSLGINSGFYPHCTSRECTVQQLMVDCALPLGRTLMPIVHGVCRTYPIRVANRFKDGVQVGTSGPCYPDQEEIEWSDIGREPELTTVTKLSRRIFTFSQRQVADACRMNGCDYVFLNFANYVAPDKNPQDYLRLENIVGQIESHGARVRWLGWGPNVMDIEERT